MIYITQLIFVKEGKEATFLEFEDDAIPLMKAEPQTSSVGAKSHGVPWTASQGTPV
jgi:hypothetical protein